MTSVRFFSLALLLGVTLAACGPSLSGGVGAAQTVPPTAPPTHAAQATPAVRAAQATPAVQAVQAAPAQDLARTDEQGAVTVAVTPLNLSRPGQTLDFEVAMNTHSVDLSMDLAALATLTTDTGRAVQATGWDAPKGGHHASGRLSFPATVGGVSLLKGAKKLTLTLQNVDAPERAFTWDLSGQ